LLKWLRQMWRIPSCHWLTQKEEMHRRYKVILWSTLVSRITNNSSTMSPSTGTCDVNYPSSRNVILTC
jgi:hypothetical protein